MGPVGAPTPVRAQPLGGEMGAGASASGSSGPMRPVVAGSLRAGDQIAIERSVMGVPYMHHGIYVGGGATIHYQWTTATQQANHPLRRTQIRRTSLEEFLGAQHWEDLVVVEYPPDADPPEQVVARAHALLGEGSYNGLWRNCEHFAVFCKTGTSTSKQITRPLEHASSSLDTASQQLSGAETRPLLYAGAPAGCAASLFPPSRPVSIPAVIALGAVTGSAKVTAAALKMVARASHSSDNVWRTALRRQTGAHRVT